MIHQKSHGAAIKAGLERHGIDCVFTDGDRIVDGVDFHVTWGAATKRPRIFEFSKDHSLPVLVMERAYLPDRMEFTAIGWNGLNNRAIFPDFRDGGDRFRRLWSNELKPWKRAGSGRYILVCGQVPGDASVTGVNLNTWVDQVIKNAWGEVVFRPHPVLIEREARIRYPKGCRLSTNEKLEDDLIDAKLCVTYNSNSGVEAVLAGVPAVAFDMGSMAWPVTSHRVLNEIRPDRTPWAHKLAFSQWTIDEIRAGTAWDYLKNIREPFMGEAA